MKFYDAKPKELLASHVVVRAYAHLLAHGCDYTIARNNWPRAYVYRCRGKMVTAHIGIEHNNEHWRMHIYTAKDRLWQEEGKPYRTFDPGPWMDEFDEGIWDAWREVRAATHPRRLYPARTLRMFPHIQPNIEPECYSTWGDLVDGVRDGTISLG